MRGEGRGKSKGTRKGKGREKKTLLYMCVWIIGCKGKEKENEKNYTYH